MMRFRLLTITSSLVLSFGLCYADGDSSYYNLKQVYNIASQHNATYKAAFETFKANIEGVPIARGALLPNVGVTSQFNYNYTNQTSAGQKEWYFSNVNTATLTQVLFDFGLWSTYTQAQYQAKADAITYDIARQTLILDVASAYFNILQAEDNLEYNQASQQWNAELLKQTQQKYDVGLAAITDVQSTKANYEQSVADTVQAKNDLENSYEALAQITGTMIENVTPLKENFPFAKPEPTDIQKWVDTAMQKNLTIISNQFLTEVSKEGIDIAWANFLPSVTGSATASRSDSYQTNPDEATNTASLSATGTLNLLNGGSDYATLKQSKYALKSSEYTLQQSQRDTKSLLRQAYLTVISDISQVSAYGQAVIANESSLKAMRAQYNVGTSTIVDLLNQQQLLLQAQQEYAQAKYAYINDILTLKQQAGTLAPQDLYSINQWLGLAANTDKKSQSTTNKPDSSTVTKPIKTKDATQTNTTQS
ncbi:TolC family outer membrane protein [Thiotrichales bacterium 19S3-7]|nr:TolC family outer membrane protein [Thiotrichales bacterium 19S3-7]MCF6802336.1 TolC family outer membrane protein [Thiotrichales bacterium 19S3-11]